MRATSFQPFSPSFASASPFGYQVQSPVMCAPSMDMYQHPSTSPSFVGSNYGPSPIGSSQTSPGSEPSSTPMFWIQSLKGTRIRMCYGCKSPMRTDTSIVPLPPYDFVIGYKERRWYRDPTTQAMKLSPKQENTYYHFSRCVEMKHPSFNSSMLYVPPVILLLCIPCSSVMNLVYSYYYS